MEKTLFQEIEAFVTASQGFNDLNKVTKTEKLVHIGTGEVLPELSALDVIKKNIDLTQYQNKVTTVNPRLDLVSALTGNSSNMLSDSEMETLAALYELGKELNTKVKSQFQLAMSVLNARKAKAKDNKVELLQIKTEIAELLVERFKENGTKPKATTDKETLAIYEKLIAAQ